MAYNRKNGLVYIPARESNSRFGPSKDFDYKDDNVSFNKGTNGWDPSFTYSEDEKANQKYGKLIAYDPVKQKEIWVVKQNTDFNGGVFTTNELVFQGNAEGEFVAFDGDSGEKLWSYNLESGILAPPVTYMVDGVQYISIAVGWGGIMGLMGKIHTKRNNPGTVYTFALGGNQNLPEFEEVPSKRLIDIPVDATKEEISNGNQVYISNCTRCHGAILPDLKYSSIETYALFKDIVGNGLYLGKGMPNFKDVLSEIEIQNLKKYLLSSAKINSIDIRGDAVGGLNNPKALTKTTESEKKWATEFETEGGDLIFRANNTWNFNWGGFDFPNGELIPEGKSIKVKPGKYKVVIDLDKMIFQFTNL